ncbi:MAG: WYL domain-containing protein [Gemmatimonadaceae bacterium]
MTERRSGVKKKSRVAGGPSNLKLQRWIDLVATLLSHRYGVTAAQLRRDVPGYSSGAAKASVDRTFERDKDELRAFGIPIEDIKSDTDDEHRYVIDVRDMYLPFLTLASAKNITPRSVPRAGYRALPSLAFEPDEMAAVLRGCEVARSLGDPALTSDIDSAARKLTFDLVLAPALPDVDRAQLRFDGEAQHADGLRTIGEALLRRKRVTFVYRTIGREDASAARSVEPYGLFFHHGHWYLAARDVEKGDVRNFRVSRMSDIVANETKHQTPDFKVPATFRLTDHAQSREPWELGDGAAEEMVLEFRGESGASRAAAKLGSAIPGQPQCRAFQVRRRDAFVRWILSFSGEIVPVASASLVDEYRSMVRATLSLYSAGAR